MEHRSRGGTGPYGAWVSVALTVVGSMTALAALSHTSAPGTSSRGVPRLTAQALALAPALSAHVHQWTNVTPAISPPDRTQDQLAYDPSIPAVILFGGNYPFANYAYADTWEFHAGTWTQLNNSSASPNGRWGASFAYDRQLGGTVLFGGRNATNVFNDTWMFHNGTWKIVRSAASPSGRLGAAMTNDPLAGGVLLYGGGVGNLPAGSGSPWRAFGDTWLLDRHGWHNITTSVAGAPGPRLGAHMVYFRPLGEVVMIGGTDAANGSTAVIQNETWTLNVSTGWTRLNLSLEPSQDSMRGAMVFDSGLHLAVLFGGQSAASNEINATWVFTGTTWRNWTAIVGPAPPPRGPSGFAYDPAIGRAVLFGGTRGAGSILDAGTWEFR